MHVGDGGNCPGAPILVGLPTPTPEGGGSGRSGLVRFDSVHSLSG